MRYGPVLLIAIFSSFPLAAQEPTPVPDSAKAPLAVEPLVVRDDDGNVIAEDLIAARMRGPKHQLLRPFLGAVVGLSVFVAMTNPSNDCSIYEPCTAREKFRMNVGPIVGMFVGGVLGAAMRDPGVNRWQAVQAIRDERRAEKNATSVTPP